MDATALFNRSREALAIAGPPEWDSPEIAGAREQLRFFTAGEAEGGPMWALATVAAASDEAGSATDGIPGAAGVHRVEYSVPGDESLSDDARDDIVALDAQPAEVLVRAHLQAWLLQRGWQVQVSMRKDAFRWRLVDCLSPADGGGDRLDEDYPSGEDETEVICEAVVVIARSAPAAVGPPAPSPLGQSSRRAVQAG
ncbi:MAG: hypothetical protein HY763_07850 [Planctomycetes bacterium]|nr:hypothetical protein [Planctomycetota bacterium]